MCGEPARDRDSPTTVVNPRLVVEVLADWTIDCDRGEKLAHFRQTPSLAAVALVWHTEPRIELHQRTSGAWPVREARSGERVAVDTIACTLDVDEICRDAIGP